MTEDAEEGEVAGVVEGEAAEARLEILQRVRVSREKSVLLRLIQDVPLLTRDGENEALLGVGVAVFVHHMSCPNDHRLHPF